MLAMTSCRCTVQITVKYDSNCFNVSFQKRTRVNPTPVTMEERVHNKEITTNALVEKVTQATSVKVRTSL